MVMPATITNPILAPLATATELTTNQKLGAGISATSAAQASCGNCPFLHDGCYAESGPMGAFITARLNRAATTRAATALDVAYAEAAAIDRLTGNNPMRLHVVGDCPNNRCARIVAAAAMRYKKRHNKPVWTYTHSWREVQRKSWRGVSVLASCEHPDDLAIARARGYAPAIVLPSFDSDKAYRLPNGEKVVPCPEQTGRANSCADCRLCFDDGRLLEMNAAIAFKPHGSQAKKVVAKLISITGVN